MSADEGRDPSPRPSPLRKGRGGSVGSLSAIAGPWKGVTVITHPLVQHNLTRLRDKRTGPQEFRRVLSEVASLMVYEATRSFSIGAVAVRTPLAKARGSQLEREVVLVPVLRAGLGMLDSIL